ncbi:perlucin-like [Ostrea edulis]|uniref:perlucin-like n=1 Tax=Ostrea edulis TaxID=37623 RepID=UPI002095731C|nr:perlucin-like [Ostrea edulis]
MDIVTSLFVLSATATVHGASFNPCPDSWYLHGRSCYGFVKDIKTDWIEAGAFCERFSSFLVEVDTKDENDFLRNHIGTNHDTYWLGATDAFSDGNWIWVGNQRPLTFLGWSPGEPANGAGAACLTLAGNLNHHWNDDYCDRKYGFICEKEIELAMGGGGLVG